MFRDRIAVATLSNDQLNRKSRSGRPEATATSPEHSDKGGNHDGRDFILRDAEEVQQRSWLAEAKLGRAAPSPEGEHRRAKSEREGSGARRAVCGAEAT